MSRVKDALTKDAEQCYEAGLDDGDPVGEVKFRVYNKYEADGYADPEDYLENDPFVAGALQADFDAEQYVEGQDDFPEVRAVAEGLVRFRATDEEQSTTMKLGSSGKGAEEMRAGSFLSDQDTNSGLSYVVPTFNQIFFVRKNKKSKKNGAKEEEKSK